MQVEVLAEDIAQGERQNARNDLVARAMRRAGFDAPFVDYTDSRLVVAWCDAEGNLHRGVAEGNELVRKLTAWDRRHGPDPEPFVIDLKEVAQ